MTESKQILNSDLVEDADRAHTWAATMSGNDDGSVIRAHKGIVPYIPFSDTPLGALSGGNPVFDLQARIELEATCLSKSATFSSKDGKRKREKLNTHDPNVPYAQDDFRTCFEHDRDRIKHSQPFRRLAGKTQVHLDRNDHQRTRLLHSLEVEQIALAISRALRLNEALTSAIALGHDCGHGPGGHASEDALSPFLPEGFNHAIWGADVTLDPLNLCHETLDGIRNHSWSLGVPETPEAEVVSFADRIAYVCHDLEDALSCAMIQRQDFPKELSAFMLLSRGQQIDYFIRAVVHGSISSQSIAIDKEAGEIMAGMRRFNLEKIYRHPISQKSNDEVIEKVQTLVEAFSDDIEKLPEKVRLQVDDRPDDKLRIIVGYVAGMTDDFAYREFDRVVLGGSLTVDPNQARLYF